MARVRHKSTPMLLCRFRNAAFYSISVDAFCILSEEAREGFSCEQGALMSTATCIEIQPLNVARWLVCLATCVCFCFFQITEQKQPKQMCLWSIIATADRQQRSVWVCVHLCGSLHWTCRGWSIWVWQQVIKAEASDQGEKQGEENFQLIWPILCYGILH